MKCGWQNSGKKQGKKQNNHHRNENKIPRYKGEDTAENIKRDMETDLQNLNKSHKIKQGVTAQESYDYRCKRQAEESQYQMPLLKNKVSQNNEGEQIFNNTTQENCPEIKGLTLPCRKGTLWSGKSTPKSQHRDISWQSRSTIFRGKESFDLAFKSQITEKKNKHADFRFLPATVSP